MYWGDYLRDTAHLDAAESGAYLHLIAHYWTNGGPLEYNAKQFARVCKITASKWRFTMPILKAFFDVSLGVWHHKRIDEELTKAIEYIEKRAKQTSAATAARRQAYVKRNVQRNEDHTTTIYKERPLTGSKERPPTKNVTRGSRLLPPWRPSDKLIAWAKKARPDLDLDSAVNNFIDYWVSIPGQRGLKLNWDRTFQVWIRRENGNAANRRGSKTAGQKTEDRRASISAGLHVAGYEPSAQDGENTGGKDRGLGKPVDRLCDVEGKGVGEGTDPGHGAKPSTSVRRDHGGNAGKTFQFL